MKLRVLHVVTDPSFMSFSAAAFEEAIPGANTFVAVDFDASRMDLPEAARIEAVASDRAGVSRLGQLIARSQVVVFHRVPMVVARALASAPPSVLRVWSGWGGDYYGTTFNPTAGLLGPSTHRLVHKARRSSFWTERAIATVRYGRALNAAARATDVFSAPIPGDLEVFRRRFPGFHGRFGQLNYVSIEDSIVEGPDRASGGNILLGNSASPTNNHSEVLEVLASQDLAGRQVLVPLSYGEKDYASSIVSTGRELLGDGFEPITEFLPLDDYHALLSSCGIAVFGHRRQEGLGNILRALWQGTHLVLDRRNPVLGYLQERGVAVTILDEVPTNGLPSGPPSDAEVAANRAFLREDWGRDTVIRNIHALIDLRDE